ncbi:NfeD family protein [Hugenholtzia roseola]|uniref:NfeD family protein n=1 Tax=Hugenholtzia roseola TaxID=1002 RepID=UPI0004024FE3|nr:NfeD family protein [Hugenholtzia roseola]
METFIIIFLMLSAVAFLIGELFLLPSGKLGLLGAFLALLSAVIAFFSFGLTASVAVLGAGVALGLGALFYGLKAKTWERLSLKQTLQGKFNDEHLLSVSLLNVGEKGKAQSALRPMGNAIFHQQVYEVSPLGEWVDAGSEVEIVRIEKTKIFVKKVDKKDKIIFEK